MLAELKKKSLFNIFKIRRRLTIKLLLNVLVVIAIITSLITSMEGLRNLNNTNNALFSMYSDIVMPTDYIQSINSSFFEMRINAYKAFRLNVFKEYDKNYNVNVQNLYKDIMNKINEYEKKQCTNEEKQLITQLKNNLSDYMNVWKYYNETMEKKEEINDLFKFNTVGNKTQNTINELVKINRDIAKGIYEKNKHNFRLTLIREIMVIVFGVILLLLISLKIIKTMVREIKEINEIIYELSNANFTVKIKSQGNNEFAKMKKLLEEMTVKVSSLIKNVKISTENLNKSSYELSTISEEMAISTQELSKTMQNVSEGSLSQGNQFKEIVCLITELSYKIENVYEKIKEVKGQTYCAIEKVNDGNEEMNNLVKSINDIRAAFKTVIDKVSNLTVSVKEVNNITNVINLLSEQTNLLSLNAAIEAARAGEAGRGFAVVAEEVKKLAERTKKSTEDISKLLKSIQNDTIEVIKTSNNVDNLINQQINMVENSVVVFDDILDSVQKIEPLMLNTFEEIKDMEKAKDNVLERINLVNEVTKENIEFIEEVAASSEELSSSSEEVAATALSLSSMANNLSDIVNKFSI